MLTASPPSPNVIPSNQQTPQLLSSPNARSVEALQGYARMGLRSPGGLATPGSSPNWPQAGFGAGMPQLSQSPLNQQNMAAIIAALRGGAQ